MQSRSLPVFTIAARMLSATTNTVMRIDVSNLFRLYRQAGCMDCASLFCLSSLSFFRRSFPGFVIHSIDPIGIEHLTTLLCACLKSKRKVQISASLPTLHHDDVIALTRLRLSPLRVPGRAGLEFERHVLKLWEQASFRFPP